MPTVMIVAIGATAAWGAAVIALRCRGRRRSPAEGPTPPAVLAALDAALEAAGRREDPRVLNAALMELAAQGVIEVIPADTQGPVMLRPAAPPYPDPRWF
jgi:hypothetical protein